MPRYACLASVLLGCWGMLKADVVLQRWSAGQRGGFPDTVKVIDAGEGASVIQVDLKDALGGVRIHQARLLVSRPLVTGDSDEAAVKVEVYPLTAPYAAGRKPALAAEPLKLIPPWYDSFDVTDAVRAAAGKGGLELYVKAFPKWEQDKTRLEVLWEGPYGKKVPAARMDIGVLHRAGQTFITWKELDDPFTQDKPVTLAGLREAREQAEATREVRYRIYRHTVPIDQKSILQAEVLAEVKPFSGFNLRGVALDRLIYQHQLRAIDDALFARSIAPGPFGGYSASMAQMGEVVVDRLGIEDAKPLPPGTGLHVHQPAQAGKAYYAVVPIIDGQGVFFAAASVTKDPLQEQPGPGAPVFQGTENLKVFYDYPGQRRRYVQWCGPPLTNLPSEYFNWGMYLPPAALAGGSEGKEKLALAIYFHDAQPLYLRPRWPHRRDMITLSPQDAPLATFGYGHHECLGTLRPFSEGRIHDYTARRVDAFVDWVCKTFPVDLARLSTHGMGVYGGTAALHYALRQPKRFALVVAGVYDPDPKMMPAQFRPDSNYPLRKTHLEALQAVWGKREWDLKTEKDVSIWKDRDLVEFVANNPAVDLPFLSLGSGSMHPTWPQENAFLKALMKARQPFQTEFYWGGQAPQFGPLWAARNRLCVVTVPSEQELLGTPWYKDDRWQKAAIGYWGGGAISTGLGWNPDNVLDTPDRLEVTVSGTSGELTIRNAQAFRLKPGEQVNWELKGDRPQSSRSGQAAADDKGMVVLQGVGKGRLILVRGSTGAAGAP